MIAIINGHSHMKFQRSLSLKLILNLKTIFSFRSFKKDRKLLNIIPLAKEDH